MAVDVSKNMFELFSGRKRTKAVPTLAVACLVTLVVAIPFLLRAIDGRNAPVEAPPVMAADAAIVQVDMASTDPIALDSARVSGSVIISLDDPAATAVSFNLYAAGDDEVLLASRDTDGPHFDLVESASGSGQPLDTTLLSNGDYELFITLSSASEDRRTAVTFTVAN